MTAAATVAKRPEPRKQPVYRGVALSTATPGRTRFSPSQLKKAVETAVARNAGALARAN